MPLFRASSDGWHPLPPQLARRVTEITENKFDADLVEMKGKTADQLKELYKARDIEPQ